MKIGLVRHFKVKQEYPKGRRVGASEVKEWFQHYDKADIEEGNTDLGGVEWSGCFTSDLPRAIRTGEYLFAGAIHRMPELREIPVPEFRTNAKLPFMGWGILIQFSWIFNRQTRLDIRHAKERINTALDQILSQENGNVLIVSHAALMKYMRKELVRKGFRGPKFNHPENGKLYLFEKQ